jgi:phosphoribosylanthranilate isomerase
MRVRVKICGLTTPEAVAAAVHAGADAIGFVFAPSPRQVTPQVAARLARAIPPQVARVAVFHHPLAALVDEVLAALAPDWVQAEAEDAPLFAAQTAVRFLPVFHDSPGLAARIANYCAADSRGAAAPGAPWSDPILVEGAASGRGLRADWERVGAVAAGRPLVLSGGLDADNVAEAIRRVRPWGVDVSSGVESSRGVKDAARIAAFVAAVRRREAA